MIVIGRISRRTRMRGPQVIQFNLAPPLIWKRVECCQVIRAVMSSAAIPPFKSA